MPVDRERLIADAIACGATHAGIVEMRTVRFYPEVRRLCQANACGLYGRNWMCPPGVGTLEELARRVKRFERGVLFQTVGSLTDSFDVEGMGEAAKRHKTLLRALRDHFETHYRFPEMLTMGAGPCDVCRDCTFPVGTPCRLPDRAVSSLEAYGMNVKQVVESCGLSYMNGKNTVSYVGLILYAE